ncbi:hypothetical protein [Streptomyces sp. t39]|uniref:hypothetical protein n=1 Tax=Streptomyces sp. t39 TaxID=1828156 RepID=UPI0011CEB1F6|nr:hypothetical protein [Streptomyces sp. t39]TXS52750.1 hypothetical protein EAO77_19460 [Streptomyces sp. t39]
MAHTRFPHDLIETQQDLVRAYARLARSAPGGSTELRRRVIRLSSRVAAHPYWSSPAGAGGSLGELRAPAREGRAGGGSP